MSGSIMDFTFILCTEMSILHWELLPDEFTWTMFLERWAHYTRYPFGDLRQDLRQSVLISYMLSMMGSTVDCPDMLYPYHEDENSIDDLADFYLSEIKK